MGLFFIEDVGDSVGFFGVDLSWDNNGNIIITQTGFIDQIFTSLDLDYYKVTPNKTPT